MNKKYLNIIILSLFSLFFMPLANSSGSDALDGEFKFEQCTADDVDSIYTKVTKRKHSDRLADLYIDTLRASQLYQQSRALFIDLRKEQKFSEYRIPSSINLPLNQLRNKNIFKSKKLVLVSDGKKYRQLEKSVVELIKLGFSDVKILEGGIRAWRDKVRLIDGRSQSAERLATMSVAEFLNESAHGPWLVVDVGKKATFKETINGEAVHLPLNKVFDISFNEMIRKKDSKLLRVIFVSEDKTFASQINNLKSKLDVDVFNFLAQTTDFIPVYKKQYLAAYRNSTGSISRCKI